MNWTLFVNSVAKHVKLNPNMTKSYFQILIMIELSELGLIFHHVESGCCVGGFNMSSMPNLGL